MIPKIIWTYWNTDKLPELVELCIETWRTMNPDYKINVVTENNYKEYIDTDIKKWRHYSTKEHARTSDYVRLCLLKKYGGVWMDASIICIKPLIFEENIDFYAYYLDNPGIVHNWRFPAIENWFIASSENNEFIKKWHDEFVCETEKYISMDSYRIHANIELPIYITGGYFAMHAAAQVVLKNMYNVGKHPKLTLREAFGSGPLEYCAGPEKYVKSICTTDFYKIQAPMIKLRNTERTYLQSNKEGMQCVINTIKEFISRGPYKLKAKKMGEFGTHNLDTVFNSEYPYTNKMSLYKNYLEAFHIFVYVILSVYLAMLLVVIIGIVRKNFV